MAESTSTTQDPPVLDIYTMGPHLKASTRIMNLPEIRQMVMVQLDPLSLLNLVSVSGLALATFKRYPTMHLNSTLAVLNIDDNAGTIPTAILEASKTQLGDGYVVGRKRRGRSRMAGQKQPTDLEKFLNEFVRKGHWRFPDNVQQPLDSLRQLARIHEAVEILMNSGIWTCIRHPRAGAKSSMGGRWFSKKEEMKRVLWVYQLYCTIYHRSGSTGCGEVLFPSKKSQLKYIRLVEEQESPKFMKRLVSIYRDLSSFLAKLYENDWTRIFYDNYRYYSSFSQSLREGFPMTGYEFVHPGYSTQIVGPEFLSDRKVVHDTHCDFYQYIDYQMSKGLPHLAQMYLLSLKSKPLYPVQRYCTDSFFTNAFYRRSSGRPDLSGSTPTKGYLLEPLEEGKKGYRLSLTVPSTRGDYLLRVAKPLFADEDFKPTHLGGLKHCRLQSRRW
ncbi:MAG: hypothetical protein HETSPECPRED_006038 [Heterodermia speciosa]|uniref:Uncharacterized protein n=1 Tax=Heterodermia speciosa TaxID=116794 RepID=A0A8H3IA78_9LECA|nr:MAG: hypothetical protein HETSPECPRED_006038 [Heterodermia speciosa]